MQFTKTYRLLVTPHPFIALPGKEDWMMGESITEQYLIEYGKKKNAEQVESGAKNPVSPNYYINKRRRYLKYVMFKQALKAEAQKQLYMPRTHDIWIKFYLPMFKSWGKKKRNLLNYAPHVTRPDCSNLCKGFEDSLFEDDSVIYDFRASKFWIDMSYGFIEVELGTLPPCNGYTQIIRKSDVLE